VSSRQRLVNLGIAVVIAVIAVVVILVASGGSDDAEKPAATPAATPAPSTQPQVKPGEEPTSTPTEAAEEPPPPEIVVKDGKVVGGVARFRVKQGERVQFSVTADVADEVHVHAYDFMKDIEAPGDTVTFDFKADITGITEVELEDAGLQIASLRVDP
jgi:hypothetical protein